MSTDRGAAAADFNIANDALVGGDQIAAFTGETRRKIFRLLSRGLLPGWKRGGEWICSKQALLAHYRQQTGLAS
jgi:hypothetical protein